ncbi:hypothetical protein CMK14_08155 [Candidatus Poribacteria bacterium]|nr:hypothetical protein [Candidatus Poribacteria bacterium]
MKTEPTIPQHQLQQQINQNYCTNLQALAFLPIGEGSWCFHGQGKSEIFIRLVKEKTKAEKTVLLAKFLSDQGLPVLPSLADKSGNLMGEIEGCGLIIYPFIYGSTLMNRELSNKQASPLRREIGVTVARIHALTELTDNQRYSNQLNRNQHSPIRQFDLPREDFARFQVESFSILSPDDHQPPIRQHDDALVVELSDFIQPRQKALRNLIGVARRLGQTLRLEALDYVLCHGDIHEDNILLSDSGEIFIIDWDNAIFAPKERDLFFFGGNEDYLTGYFGGQTNSAAAPGTCVVDQTVIDYYVLEWALQEIVDYGSRILFDTHFDMEGRVDAWQQFQRLFEPGQDVDVALTLVDKMEGEEVENLRR